MTELLHLLSLCVERGKATAEAMHPPDMRGKDGAAELTRHLLDEGVTAQDILNDGLMPGMRRVGQLFRDRKIFVPDVLLAARAMHAAMDHLRPHFVREGIPHRGTFVIGTVRGDLHDIGKKIVGMVVEGAGWNVVDLGTDVQPERFVAALAEHPGAGVGMSALLTTTMANMQDAVSTIRASFPRARIIVGGAPVTADFALGIGADAYGADPHSAVEFLESGVDA